MMAARFGWAKYEFRGQFADWRSAEEFLRDRGPTGYDNSVTASKYVAAAMASLAASIGPPLPQVRQLASALQDAVAAAALPGRVRVLDFGGAAGGEFIALCQHSSRFKDFQWTVVELSKLAVLAKREISPRVPGLRFVSRLVDAGPFDLLYTSGALQYVAHWQAELSDLLAHEPACIVCTRVPIYHERSFVTCQNAGETRYPAWVWSRADFVSPIELAGYRLVSEFYVPQDRLILEGKTLIDKFSGFIFVRQS
jgi:putative methyltransferase (TIGR04325 family)